MRGPITHELKTLPRFFDLVWRGIKPFEVRKDDRGFHAGDTLLLREWTPGEYPRNQWGTYSGATISVPISYVLKDDEFGGPLPVPLPTGIAVLGLDMSRKVNCEFPSVTPSSGTGAAK